MFSVLKGGTICAPHVQFLTQIEWQFFGPLRFNNSSILLENQMMSLIQLIVGQTVWEITTCKAIILCLFEGNRAAEINFCFLRVTTNLPLLYNEHERKNYLVKLFGCPRRLQFIDRRFDSVLEPPCDRFDV